MVFVLYSGWVLNGGRWSLRLWYWMGCGLSMTMRGESEIGMATWLASRWDARGRRTNPFQRREKVTSGRNKEIQKWESPNW